MADLQDVQDTLASLIAGVIYPQGTGAPSVTGGDVRIFAGWPAANKLDADLRAGVANVSVFTFDTEKNTSRYLEPWGELSRGTKTIGATVDASVKAFTLTGTVATPQIVTAIVNGTAFSRAVQDNDTLTTIAAGLATLITAFGIAASSSGPTVSIPDAYRITVNIGVNGKIARVTKRQEKLFQVDIWAASNDARGALAKAIDPMLSDMSHIALPDGTSGRMIYVRSQNIDETQPELLYRRVLCYSVDYPTIITADATEITSVAADIAKQDGDTVGAVFRVQRG